MTGPRYRAVAREDLFPLLRAFPHGTRFAQHVEGPRGARVVVCRTEPGQVEVFRITLQEGDADVTFLVPV